MPARPDDPLRLSGSRLCEITGVNRQTRDTWTDAGLLRKGNDYDQFDLVELVVLKLLLDTLPKKHAKFAWTRVRSQLKELMPGPQLTLVWDPQRRSAELAFDAEAIIPLVRHGRPVQVLDLGSAVELAREAFRREAEAVAAQQAAREALQSSRSKRRHSSS
jgi:hypothetical protein